jgi:hypothetical protein
MATGFGRVERCRVAAAHHGEHAVLRTGLAAGHRRIDKLQAQVRACGNSSRATSADAVVWSTRPRPGFMPAKAPSGPSTTERRSSSLPTQQNTMSAPRAACAWRGRRAPLNSAAQASALAGGAVVDRDLVAGARQVAGHGVAHDAQAQKGDFAGGGGVVGAGWCGCSCAAHGMGVWQGS